MTSLFQDCTIKLFELFELFESFLWTEWFSGSINIASETSAALQYIQAVCADCRRFHQGKKFVSFLLGVICVSLKDSRLHKQVQSVRLLVRILHYRNCCTDVMAFIIGTNHGSRQRVFCIVTGLLRNGGSIPVRGNISLLIVGPTQPIPGVGRSRVIADSTPVSGVEVKNNGAMPPLSHTPSWPRKGLLYLILLARIIFNSLYYCFLLIISLRYFKNVRLVSVFFIIFIWSIVASSLHAYTTAMLVLYVTSLYIYFSSWRNSP